MLNEIFLHDVISASKGHLPFNLSVCTFRSFLQGPRLGTVLPTQSSRCVQGACRECVTSGRRRPWDPPKGESQNSRDWDTQTTAAPTIPPTAGHLRDPLPVGVSWTSGWASKPIKHSRRGCHDCDEVTKGLCLSFGVYVRICLSLSLTLIKPSAPFERPHGEIHVTRSPAKSH